MALLPPAKYKVNPIAEAERQRKADQADRLTRERAERYESDSTANFDKAFDDTLKEVYGIDPKTPFRKRVVILYEEHSLTAAEIAEVLSADKGRVASAVEEIEKDIQEAGREQTDEDKRRKRILYIRKLRRNADQLQVIANGATIKDPQLFTKIADLNAKIMKLEGLDVERERNNDNEENGIGVALTTAIAALPPDQIEALRARLAAA